MTMAPIGDLKDRVQGVPGNWYISVTAADLRALLAEIEYRRTQMLQLRNTIDHRDQIITEHTVVCPNFDGSPRV